MRWFIKVNGKKQAEEYLNRLYALGCHWLGDNDGFVTRCAPDWFGEVIYKECSKYIFIGKATKHLSHGPYVPSAPDGVYTCTNIEKLEQELKNENTTRK